ncbi:unnamed protein product [Phytomonas sp. Hart1]|nr:unnamed protein product [Phytomonas sp. Hart1]|eukprot:CCW71801.1 unnamed protein product [Phytomonas sp. isolate Hart1]
MQRVFQMSSGRQAVEEMEVFLRMMSRVQRRWTKIIANRENKVRKLMMIEGQCRDRLTRNVLRGTHANLKYLVNTDLISTAEVAAPPPSETFQLYGIPPSQITPFSVYAISRLWADPDRVDLPLLTLIADFQSAWAILPLSKKAVYEQLADTFRERSERSCCGAAAIGADTQPQNAKQVHKPKRERSTAKRQCKELGDVDIVKPMDPTDAKASNWEESAFRRFVKLSMQQMRAALGDKCLLHKEWDQIAKAEWESKSVRQKQCYL